MTIALQMFLEPYFLAAVGVIGEWPWLKFLPLILAFVITLCEAFTRGPKRRWFFKLLLPSLSAAALTASCWIVWSDDKNARESQTQASNQWNRIEGKLGNEEATKKYLDAVGNLTRQLTAAKTGNSVDKFFSSKDERQKLRDEVDKANRKLLLEHEIRMNPVRDYVIAKFDDWLIGIRKRGIKVEITNSDVPAVSVGVQRNGAAREAVFESGDKIMLQFYSARIVDGRLTGSLHCQMPFLSGKGQFQAGEVFGMDMEESRYTITNTRPSRFTYKPYEGNADNPIEDQEFITRLDQALDEVMAFVVEEATVAK
jgi:hypothetical protein